MALITLIPLAISTSGPFVSSNPGVSQSIISLSLLGPYLTGTGEMNLVTDLQKGSVLIFWAA
jgi:hypothetical protein